jgi:hypothetical protein
MTLNKLNNQVICVLNEVTTYLDNKSQKTYAEIEAEIDFLVEHGMGLIEESQDVIRFFGTKQIGSK